jgi:hypothetical protein
LPLLFIIQGISSPPPKKDFFILGNLSRRNVTHSTTTHEQLKVHIEGLENNIPFLTLEDVFFSIFFPQGEGAYDERISLHDYFKYFTSLLFSPFVLYKPCLLFMYDLCQ